MRSIITSNICSDSDAPLSPRELALRFTDTEGAVAAVQGFVVDGLFIGQSQAFFDVVGDLAKKADAARRLG